MKNILYVLLILSCILFNSCKAKLKYYPFSDTPYSIFMKGTNSGVMVTETKQVLIPANYGWIDRRLTDDTYSPTSKQIFYVGSYREDTLSMYVKSFLFNVNGKLLYTFDEGEDVKSLFYHNKQLYLITKKQLWGEETIPDRINIINYDDKLFRLDANKDNAAQLCAYPSIKHLGKNMIYLNPNNQFGYFDLNTDKKNLFEKHSRDSQRYLYVKEKNEIWTSINQSETEKSNEYYDTVIDSTLSVKPNPAKNVLWGSAKYYFSQTEKGIQVVDFDGTASPFAYPFLEPVKNRVAFYINTFGREAITDKLFTFSPHKEGDIIGIIDLSGKIILPAEFNQISMKEIIPNTQPSDEFLRFLNDNKLLGFYYFAIKNEANYNVYAIYNQEGTEIIRLKEDKNNNCSCGFDFMEKNRLQIKFYCSNDTKTFDLLTKELISTEKKR